MDGFKKLLGTAAFDFGGVIVFYLLFATIGLRAAIIGTLVFVPLDAARRHWLGIGFPRLYILSTAMVLIFGSIDVFSKTPFMLKYEGSVTETLVGIAFAIGARGKSIIEELVLQQQPDFRIPHRRRYFQLVTATWSLYFFCMAGFYLWVGLHSTLGHAVIIRQVAGIAGSMAMAVFSFSGSFAAGIYKALGLLPREADPDYEAATNAA